MNYTIIRQAADGWTFAKAETNEILLFTATQNGGIAEIFEAAKDTPESRERLNGLWETNNFSKEIKRRAKK